MVSSFEDDEDVSNSTARRVIVGMDSVDVSKAWESGDAQVPDHLKVLNIIDGRKSPKGQLPRRCLKRGHNNINLNQLEKHYDQRID